LLIKPGKIWNRVLGILAFHVPFYVFMTYSIDQKAWVMVNEVGLQAEEE